MDADRHYPNPYTWQENLRLHSEAFAEYEAYIASPEGKRPRKQKGQKAIDFPVVSRVTAKTRFENMILDYIIEDMRPLSTVESAAFRRLVKGLNSDAELMCRKTLKSKLQARYESTKAHITELIRDVDFVCVTTDIWSSTHRSFIGVTCHWIQEDLNRNSAVLSLKRFKGKHTYDQIAELLQDIFTNYNLTNKKIVSVVTDNGSNFVKAFKEYGISDELANMEIEGEMEDPVELLLNLSELLEEGIVLPRHKRCASHTLSLVATCDAEKVRPHEAFKTQVQDKAGEFLKFYEKRLASEGHATGDYSIYTGSTGTALMYWHLAKVIHKSDYRQKALRIIEPIIPHLKQKRFSFLGGDAGPLALAAVLYHETGNQAKCDEMIKKLIVLGEEVVDTHDPSTSNELLFGRAGYLYSLLLVNKHTTSSDGGEKLVSDQFIEKVTNVIIKEGKRSGKPYLYYEWHDKCYLGAGHGILGIIQILLLTPDSLSQDDMDWIRKTLNWLLTLRFPSGNIPSSLGSPSDRLIHFCHGASGAIWTWFLAHKIFKDEAYLNAANDSAKVIWERGILKKGYSLCHGVASSAYGLMAAYNYTKDLKYLEQAYLFTHWCFNYGTKTGHNPDRPLSLFEGMAGVVYMFTDFGWSDSPAFPAFLL